MHRDRIISSIKILILECVLVFNRDTFHLPNYNNVNLNFSIKIFDRRKEIDDLFIRALMKLNFDIFSLIDLVLFFFFLLNINININIVCVYVCVYVCVQNIISESSKIKNIILMLLIKKVERIKKSGKKSIHHLFYIISS